MDAVAIIFWTSLTALVYAYLGYPAGIATCARLRGRPHVRRDITPSVSLVIAAHDEERTIGAKVANCMALRYPADRLRIVVGSDGSTDGTNRLLAELADRGVRAVLRRERRGKAAMLNELVSAVDTDLVVLSDARQTFHPDALANLVSNFADPTVGGATGELHLLTEDPAGREAGLGLYWRYEKWIRRSESRVHSSVGATGAIYAIRTCLFHAIPRDTVLDDVLIPMQVVRQGYRVVFDPAARAYDRLHSPRHEITRKLRTIGGTFQLFWRHPWLFSPRQNPVWFQTLSHKALRLLSPALLLALGASSAVLAPVHWMFAGAAFIQLAFYTLAALDPLLRRVRLASPLTGACYVFCLLNAATVAALVRVLAGRQSVTWSRAA